MRSGRRLKRAFHYKFLNFPHRAVLSLSQNGTSYEFWMNSNMREI